MSTQPGKIKVVYDNQYRMTVQSTTWIGTVTKGTATDLLVEIVAGADGATAISGTTTLYVQGSNLTATATSNWTTVVADKGTIAAVTAAGTQTLHFAQLQYAYYHLALSNTAASTANVSVAWNLIGLQDSYDATVA
jgi:hypothetical protein